MCVISLKSLRGIGRFLALVWQCLSTLTVVKCWFFGTKIPITCIEGDHHQAWTFDSRYKCDNKALAEKDHQLITITRLIQVVDDTD